MTNKPDRKEMDAKEVKDKKEVNSAVKHDGMHNQAKQDKNMPKSDSRLDRK